MFKFILNYHGTSAKNIYWGTALEDHIWGYGGDDELHGGDGNDSIFGGDGADSISGDSGHDWLFGQAGNDAVFGGDGNDYVSGGDGNDNVSGGAGKDAVSGDAGDDTLHGGEGDDYLSGGAGNDWINGGFGSDTILGGAGSDKLSGNTNSSGWPEMDTFVFKAADMTTISSPWGSYKVLEVDTIMDFEAGTDKIHLASLLDTLTNFTGSSAAEAIAQGYIYWKLEDGRAKIFVDPDGGAHNPSNIPGMGDIGVVFLNNVDINVIAAHDFIV